MQVWVSHKIYQVFLQLSYKFFVFPIPQRTAQYEPEWIYKQQATIQAPETQRTIHATDIQTPIHSFTMLLLL